MTTELPPTIEGDGPALLCLHGGPGMSDYLDAAGRRDRRLAADPLHPARPGAVDHRRSVHGGTARRGRRRGAGRPRPRGRRRARPQLGWLPGRGARDRASRAGPRPVAGRPAGDRGRRRLRAVRGAADGPGPRRTCGRRRTSSTSGRWPARAPRTTRSSRSGWSGRATSTTRQPLPRCRTTSGSACPATARRSRTSRRCWRRATCRAAPRRTTGRWRSSTAWAARSRSRPRWRPRRRSRTGGRPACRKPATSRGSSSRAASPTAWSASAPSCSSSLDVKNLDQPG